ncbi:putative transcription regulator SAP family [Rosa chinensis]|uniref:Putative transcription regulator SAP family n=1 Tax=Rosa chinensis TaxID=74649 RepID=A0A2P6RR46_ROSCH|nr:putative transcription regulator SAP family [Rosa chinensis]
MSSPYPKLDNRTIDQWKVTELKEELKRRKLTTKGLKDDLIKRLDEAIRIERENAERLERENAERLERENAERLERENAERLERENAERLARENAERLEREIAEKIVRENAEKNIEGNAEKVDNGFNADPEQHAVDAKTTTGFIDGREKAENVVIGGSAAALNQGNIEEDYVLVDKHDTATVGEELIVQSATVETTVTVTENVVEYLDLGGQGSQNTEAKKTNENSKPQLENEDPEPQLENEDPEPMRESLVSKPQLENEDPKPQLENEDPKPQLENEDPEPTRESLDSKPQLENVDPKPQLESESLDATPKDAVLDSSAPNYQVSEVSTVLGSEVNYDYISTDTVSINEKIELKDNIIADHVKLELDVKPEMVDPSSSAVVPVNGDSHPMDAEEPPESKASVREKDDNYDTNADISKKNDSVDVGYSEKLNLERSSGDDSMEEDVLDSKQIDSKYSSDYVGDRVEKTEEPIALEDSHVDVVGDDNSSDKMDTSVDNKNHPALPAEKRKLNDKAAVVTNEPAVKRRRWNSENLKVPEPQNSIQTPTTTPKDTSQTPILKRNFSRSNSTIGEDIPKERVVPPSQKPPTNSLKIDHFLRPFTLKAVQELLGKTGKVTDFWMDHIKTHCFVTYSSVEEAVETRNAVYNLQWPTNGGRLLVADFVDPQEVQTRVQNPQTPATPVSAPVAPAFSATSQHQPSPRLSKQQLQQQLPPPPSLPLRHTCLPFPQQESGFLCLPHLLFQRNLILRLSLWMIYFEKLKQPLGSITYLYPKNK